ncbi:MAG: DUF3301 domain-containing protein [Gammaproteobacteria bacterium]|nr:DUF3301 domain-containing protein [Gammaproteobacteria bacterium]
MNSYAIVLTLGAIGCTWFWFDSLRARERATAVAKDFCRRSGLQLLDGTASLTGLRIKKLNGRLAIERCYQFDFTTSGNARQKGLVIMHGPEMEHFVVAADVCEC